MSELPMTMLFHFIGFGMLFTAMLGGMILNNQSKKETDLSRKALLLRATKPIGLLSPVAVLLILITGIGNMHALGYSLFTVPWLPIKIALFLIASGLGIVFGAKSRKRAVLVAQMAEGKAAEGSEAQVAKMDSQLSFFFILQSVFLLVILILSVFKPM